MFVIYIVLGILYEDFVHPITILSGLRAEPAAFTLDVVGEARVDLEAQLGRPVAKAWNAILSGTFKAKGAPAGDPTRLAIPVAADRDADKETAMTLVEDTGFDAVDAGTLADSWRQQPGAPAYCTELTREEMPAALAIAEKDVLPERRDKAMAAIGERAQAGSALTVTDLVALNRVIYR